MRLLAIFLIYCLQLTYIILEKILKIAIYYCHFMKTHLLVCHAVLQIRFGSVTLIADSVWNLEMDTTNKNLDNYSQYLKRLMTWTHNFFSFGNLKLYYCIFWQFRGLLSPGSGSSIYVHGTALIWIRYIADSFSKSKLHEMHQQTLTFSLY